MDSKVACLESSVTFFLNNLLILKSNHSLELSTKKRKEKGVALNALKHFSVFLSIEMFIFKNK